MTSPPEFNVTGIDYGQRAHLAHAGPILDFHAHVTLTRAEDPPAGPAVAHGPGASTAQARIMMETAREFGIGPTISMCLPEDIPPLRAELGENLLFNGPIQKKLDEPDEVAIRLLENYLELGVRMIKFWSAPRGRERGLFVDAPWRIEAARRARVAGIRLIMVHVGDPDVWYRTVYADSAKFGTKADAYVGLERLLDMFPDVNWIGAHMGGDVEHPDHLQALLEKYPHFHLDTSATKWQVREVSPRRDEVRRLMCRLPERFLFGSDLVTRHHLEPEHYVSRYWCQRTLWESTWAGPSPIADPDYTPAAGGGPTPLLHGVSLPAEVLRKVYWENGQRLLGGPSFDR